MSAPPHNLEAERSVLGAVFIKPAAFAEVATSLQVDDFFLPAHREIFEAMLAIDKRRQPLDVLTVGEELRTRKMIGRLEGGEVYLLTLSNSVPTAENIGHYARLVNEKATLRRLIAACAEIQSRAGGDFGDYGPFLEEAERNVQRITQLRDAGTAAKMVCLADVQPRDVDWLWPGRIPRGMPAVFDGDSGLGKTSVMMDLAARITTGQKWPGSIGRCTPSDVVFIGHEDSPEHTIRPRLDAAGADVRRVHLLSEIRGRFPRLPDDVEEIERRIRAVGACLLVIDPVSAYLGSTDIHRDNEVRAALAPLTAVADRTGAAILLIRHLRKASGVSAIHRGLGSVAITALARASMMLLRDPDDETARILAWPKLSVGPQPSSLRWRFAPATSGAAPRIVWDALPCDMSADDILDRHDSARRTDRPRVVDTTADMIRQLLEGGPMPAQELETRVLATCHSRATYKRARAQLGVVGIKSGRTWLAALPDGRDSNSQHQVVGSLDSLETLPLEGSQGAQGSQGLHPRDDAPLEREDVI